MVPLFRSRLDWSRLLASALGSEARSWANEAIEVLGREDPVALKQAEGGTAVGDVCRQMGISEATFYVWKKKYGGLSLTELRELRQLRDENSKLKRLVADLTLDRHVLQEIVKKKI